jgi:hypothetical protein
MQQLLYLVDITVLACIGPDIDARQTQSGIISILCWNGVALYPYPLNASVPVCSNAWHPH